MKVWELCKVENIDKVYVDNNGEEWKVKCVNRITEHTDLYSSKNRACLTEKYYMSEILEMDFEEVVDWSKAKVDTKVLVSENRKSWVRRYFAKYKNGKIYCFPNGATSWSNKEPLMDWKYAKLWEEGEE